MRFFVVLLICAFGILKGIQSPIVSGMFYSWVTLFRPQNFIYSNSVIPFLVPVSVFVLFFSIIFFGKRTNLQLKWNVGALFLVAIFLVCIFSGIFSSNKEAVIPKLTEISKILIPTVLLSLSVSTEKHFKMLIWTFAFSIGVWAIQGSVHGLLTGRAQASMSIGGQMSDRNDFAVGILMTMPLWYYLSMNIKDIFIRAVCYVLTFLVAASVLVTNSRAAILGLLVLFSYAFLWRSPRKVRNFFICILLACIGINFIPAYTVDRLSTINWGLEQTDGSASQRLILMEAGIECAQDNPFWGVGPGAWPSVAGQYIPVEHSESKAYEPHSVWIKLAAELGFVGLGLYLLMFIVLFRKLRHIQSKSDLINDHVWLNYSIMLQMALLAFCLPGSFFNQVYYEYLFLMVAVSGGFIRISKDRFSM